MKKCDLCPRGCGTDRSIRAGLCGTGDEIKVAKAGLHLWEEPCISGQSGSGAVFFSGCALHCVYCQNHLISDGKKGESLSVEQLTDLFFKLCREGAHNINLVTGDHFIPLIAEAVLQAKEKGFDKPFVFNCSGYEKEETLKLLSGLIDVYLPDFKYMEEEPARSYSHAPDYPETAKKAVEEMVRQQPRCVFGEDGLIKKGVIIRHLLLPGHVRNAKKVLQYLIDTYGDSVYISLLSQYTPMPRTDEAFPELARRITRREYDRLLDFAILLGIRNAYIQDRSAATDSYIPDFG